MSETIPEFDTKIAHGGLVIGRALVQPEVLLEFLGILWFVGELDDVVTRGEGFFGVPKGLPVFLVYPVVAVK